MKQHATLAVQTRTSLGHDVRKMRKSALLPAVVYSKDFGNISLQVKMGEFVRLYKETGKTKVIELHIDEGKSVPCIIHDIDVHPVRGVPRHVDFLAVNLKQKVKASVPVEYVGVPVGVVELGAVLVNDVQELEVEALPDNIPDKITIDVSILATFDDVIRISDLPKSEIYEILEEPETALASLAQQTVEEPEPVAVEEVAPVEGAVEGAPAEATSEESK
jgi:large subunit ribosomal protein L25